MKRKHDNPNWKSYPLGCHSFPQKKKQKFGTSGFKGAELFLFAAKCIVQNLS